MKSKKNVDYLAIERRTFLLGNVANYAGNKVKELIFTLRISLISLQQKWIPVIIN